MAAGALPAGTGWRQWARRLHPKQPTCGLRQRCLDAAAAAPELLGCCRPAAGGPGRVVSVCITACRRLLPACVQWRRQHI